MFNHLFITILDTLMVLLAMMTIFKHARYLKVMAKILTHTKYQRIFMALALPNDFENNKVWSEYVCAFI